MTYQEFLTAHSLDYLLEVAFALGLIIAGLYFAEWARKLFRRAQVPIRPYILPYGGPVPAGRTYGERESTFTGSPRIGRNEVEGRSSRG